MTRTLTLTLLLIAALPGAAAAHGVDTQEHRFGATNVNAQSGNGGLSVGVSARGEVTVLSWPSPTFYDQVDYETSNDDDARLQPRLGADEDMGIFGGFQVGVDGEPDRLTWLRDDEWTTTQAYASDTSGAVVTTSRHDDLGLTVTETLFVDGARDALLRRTTVAVDADSSVVSLRYLLYENAAPTATKPDDLATHPLTGFDDRNDFLAYWDPEASALVHGAPESGDAGRQELLEKWTIHGPWEGHGLDLARAATDRDGAYLAFTGAVAPDVVHVGMRGSWQCEGAEGWSWNPEAAWSDLGDDGVVGGSPVAGCDADAVLGWTLDLSDALSTGATVTLDTSLGAGATPADAIAAAAGAGAEGFDAVLARTDAAYAERAAGWAMPDGLDPEIVAFSRRALIAILQGTDRDANATVAALSTQPSYHHDWPRDSVFFDLAMDLAGEYDWVTDHKLFLAGLQNPEPVYQPETGTLLSPPGAWFMNYYADGAPSTTAINTFEIDQVGLMLWGFWAHAAFAPNDEARRVALAGVWPQIEAGANLLAACVADDHPAVGTGTPPAGHPAWWPVYEALLDGEVPSASGRELAMEQGAWEALRPCRANEDDNPLQTVSIYSTVTTRMGLLAAARAADLLCLDDDPVRTYWLERAHELGSVAFAVDWDGADWDGDRPDWLLWPEPLTIDASIAAPFDDPEALEAEALDAFADRIHGEVSDHVRLLTEGGVYENKKTLQLARRWSGDDDEAERADQNMRNLYDLAVTHAIPGVRHVGEVFVTMQDDGTELTADEIEAGETGDFADQRVSTPHLWAATLSYLTAMAIDRPELFEALESDEYPRVCVAGEEPREQRSVQDCGEDCGGGNSLAGPAARPGLAVLLGLLGLALARRRRPRR